MSALPTTPQAPAPVADPPPPNISLDDIMGGGAAAVAAAAAAAAPPAGTPAAAPEIDQSLQQLTNYFGITGEAVKDNKSAQAALKPMIDMIAQGGAQQTQQTQQPQPQTLQNVPPQQQTNGGNMYGQVAPTPPAAPVEINFDDIDLGDASPEVAKAFKQMGDRSKQALEAVQQEATNAQQAALNVQQQYEQQQQASQQAQENEVSTRAISYLDGLASAKYGVGENRTLMQTMSSEQVMRTAGNLIRGMQSYGQVMPIESVMNAAILAVDGTIPAAPAASSTPSTPNLSPTSPSGLAPPPTRGVGSTGMAGGMMSDAEYVDGARAILNR